MIDMGPAMGDEPGGRKVASTAETRLKLSIGVICHSNAPSRLCIPHFIPMQSFTAL